METIRCPYCECKVLMSDVEDDDGACPECGAPLLGALAMDDDFAEAPESDAETDLELEAADELGDDLSARRLDIEEIDEDSDLGDDEDEDEDDDANDTEEDEDLDS